MFEKRCSAAALSTHAAASTYSTPAIESETIVAAGANSSSSPAHSTTSAPVRHSAQPTSSSESDAQPHAYWYTWKAHFASGAYLRGREKAGRRIRATPRARRDASTRGERERGERGGERGERRRLLFTHELGMESWPTSPKAARTSLHAASAMARPA